MWTYKNRVAIVLSVTHKGQPIQDALKLQRLQQLLFDMMDRQRQGIVTIKTVRCGAPARGLGHSAAPSPDPKAPF